MACTCCNEVICQRRDPFIDPLLLMERCPLDNGPKNFKNSMVRSDSLKLNQGHLQELPVEIYHQCLQHLDVAKLKSMRSVSQYTRSVIDLLPQYKELFDHAPQALRGAICVGTDAYISLLQLHGELVSMDCYYCKYSTPPRVRFGSYLSLYEGRRTCLFCLRNNPYLQPVERKRLAQLGTNRSCNLRKPEPSNMLRTIPDNYGPDFLRSGYRFTLVRGSSIETISGKPLDEKQERLIFGAARYATQNYIHPKVKQASQTRPLGTGNDMHQSITRFMSAVQFPYLTSGKQVTENGLLCVRCTHHMLYCEIWWHQSHIQIQHGRSPSMVNNAREAACAQYISSPEALLDWQNSSIDNHEDDFPGMTLEEHVALHTKAKYPISDPEVRWQKKYRRMIRTKIPIPDTLDDWPKIY